MLGTFISDVRWTPADKRIPRLSSRGRSPDEPSLELRVSALSDPLADLDRVLAALDARGAQVRCTVRNCVQNARFALHLEEPTRALAFIDHAPPPLPATPTSLFRGRPDPLAPLRAQALLALSRRRGS